MESATLTILGAAVGLVIGALLAWVVKVNTPIPASVPLSAVAVSLVSAALTGIAFGMMPAARAARYGSCGGAQARMSEPRTPVEGTVLRER